MRVVTGTLSTQAERSTSACPLYQGSNSPGSLVHVNADITIFPLQLILFSFIFV